MIAEHEQNHETGPKHTRVEKKCFSGDPGLQSELPLILGVMDEQWPGSALGLGLGPRL